MVKIFVSLLLALMSSLSFAYPGTPSGDGFEYKTGYTATWHATKVAACNQVKTYYNTGVITGMSGNACQGTYKNNFGDPATFNDALTVRSVAITYSCSSGGTLTGSACVCPSGQTDTGSACIDPNAAKCSTYTGGSDLFTGFTSFPAIGSAFCPSDGAASSCGAKVTGGFAIVKNGVKTWTYEVGYSGTTCVTPVAGTTGALTTCRGTSSVVNGLVVCIPPSNQNIIESVKSTTATNPTSAASAPGSSGGVTTGESTTCTGSTCTTTKTTSTTTSAGGVPTVTTEKAEIPKEDFCKNNPRAMACKEFSLGDVASETVTGSTVNLAINKSAGFGPATGTCPAPKSVTIMGVTLSMPYTLLCDFALMINPLLIGFAWLSAALTFFGFAKK